MIEPVSRVQSYSGVSSVGTKSGNQDGSAPFSMDQAIAEESAREEGVYYERSSFQKTEQNKPGEKKDETASSDIIEKPNPDAPMGAIDTAALFKSISKFLAGIWENIVRIFGNIWESKPLTEGVKDNIESDLTGDPLHTEDSLNFYKQKNSTLNESSIPNDEFDAAIDELSEEGESEVTGNVPEDHIKPFEDKAIKDALLSGDDERFERIITRGGERHAAISSNLLTQYDSKGRIIQIDPSDENLILHGKNRTSRS